MTLRLVFIFLFLFLSTFILSKSDSKMQELIANSKPFGFYENDPLPEKVAYLTFDDGPSDFTDDIVEILNQENVKATFFISARWAPDTNRERNEFKRFSKLLSQMVKDGHVLGNHTYGHMDLSSLNSENILKQMEENQQVLNEVLGKDAPQMTLMRPPHGAPWYWREPKSLEVQAKVGKVLKNKWLVMMWSKLFDSTDSMDWVKGEWYKDGPRIRVTSPAFQKKMERIYKRIVFKADGKGLVILFHDTHPTTWKILKDIIWDLKASGYTFGTLEDYSLWRWGKTSAELLGRVK